MDTDGSIMQLNEASTNELAMVNSRRSTVSNKRLTSRGTRDLSRPKYTNEELDSAIFEDKIKPYSSEIRKYEGQKNGEGCP